MLVYIQNSAVTFFGGVSYWKKNFSRTIKEDARPCIILAPNGPVMLVYDVMDTKGNLSAKEFINEEKYLMWRVNSMIEKAKKNSRD